MAFASGGEDEFDLGANLANAPLVRAVQMLFAPNGGNEPKLTDAAYCTNVDFNSAYRIWAFIN